MERRRCYMAILISLFSINLETMVSLIGIITSLLSTIVSIALTILSIKARKQNKKDDNPRHHK